MQVVHTLKGIGELLEVYEDKVTISPVGIMGMIRKGLQGSRTIPFFSIWGIEFKKAGLTRGYIQFSLPGNLELKKGRGFQSADDNTFMFTGQNEQAAEIAGYLEKRIQEAHKPKGSAADHGSISDEIEKLAGLKARGSITNDQFNNLVASLTTAKRT